MANTYNSWDDLTLSEQSDVMASAVRHGIMTLPEIRQKWNEFAEGGYMDEPPTEEPQAVEAAKAKYPILENLDFSVYSDPNYRASDYGYGNIETFFNGVSKIKYTPDYTYQNPRGTKTAIVYNPNRIPEQYQQDAINLDAVSHIGHDDATYEALNATIANEYPDTAAQEMLPLYMKVHKKNPAGKIPKKEWIPETLEAWDDAPKRYQNAVDGVIRQYIANKDYPNSYEAMGYAPYNPSWDAGNNSPFYLGQLYDYITTGQRPPNVLQEVTVTPNRQFADGGHLYKGGGKASQRNQKAGYAVDYFVNKGLTREQAAGLVGNLMRESNMNTEAVNPASGAYGLGQWLGDRKTKLFKKYGKHPTFYNQLDYIWDELNSTHKKGLKMLKSSKTVDDAARNAFGYYEFSAGPQGAVAAMNKWGQNGNRALNTGINYAHSIYGSSPKRSVPSVYERSRFALPQNTAQGIDFLGMADVQLHGNYNSTDAFQGLIPPNPTDYGTPIDWNEVFARPRPAVQEETTVPEDKDNGMGLLALMRNMGVFDEPEQQPLATYTAQKKSSSPFVVQAPTYNDTFLDGSWFAKGGALYKQGGHLFADAGFLNEKGDNSTSVSIYNPATVGFDPSKFSYDTNNDVYLYTDVDDQGNKVAIPYEYDHHWTTDDMRKAGYNVKDTFFENANKDNLKFHDSGTPYVEVGTTSGGLPIVQHMDNTYDIAYPASNRLQDVLVTAKPDTLTKNEEKQQMVYNQGSMKNAEGNYYYNTNASDYADHLRSRNDIDKVMLGTLALGTAPITLPELASGLTAVGNPLSDALMTTKVGQGINRGLNAFNAATASSTLYPWLDNGVTSFFGAHGINDIANGNANIDTAFELMPLVQIFRPLTFKGGINSLFSDLKGLRDSGIGASKKVSETLRPILKAIDTQVRPEKYYYRIPSTSEFARTKKAVVGASRDKFKSTTLPLSFDVAGQAGKGVEMPKTLTFTDELGSSVSGRPKGDVEAQRIFKEKGSANVHSSGSGDIVIRENPQNVQESIEQHAQRLESTIGDDGVIGGSMSNISKRNFVGVPGDDDIITTAGRLSSLMKKLGAKKITDVPGGIRVNSKHIIGGTGDIDVIGADSSGMATGLNAHEIYAQLHPREYAQMSREYALRGSYVSPNTDAAPNFRDTSLPISAEDLFDEWKQSRTEVKGLMDALGSSKDKHIGRVKVFIQNPNKTGIFREALDAKVTSQYGEPLHVDEILPDFDYSDIEANKRFLHDLGLDESLATNEDAMKNIVDYTYYSLGTSTRRVNRQRMPKGGTTPEEVESAITTNTAGMNASGRGGNSTTGSEGGGWGYGPIIGGLLEDITHGTVPKNPSSLLDRLLNRGILTKEEADKLNAIGINWVHEGSDVNDLNESFSWTDTEDFNQQIANIVGTDRTINTKDIGSWGGASYIGRLAAPYRTGYAYSSDALHTLEHGDVFGWLQDKLKPSGFKLLTDDALDAITNYPIEPSLSSNIADWNKFVAERSRYNQAVNTAQRVYQERVDKWQPIKRKLNNRITRNYEIGKKAPMIISTGLIGSLFAGAANYSKKQGRITNSLPARKKKEELLKKYGDNYTQVYEELHKWIDDNKDVLIHSINSGKIYKDWEDELIDRSKKDYNTKIDKNPKYEGKTWSFANTVKESMRKEAEELGMSAADYMQKVIEQGNDNAKFNPKARKERMKLFKKK